MCGLPSDAIAVLVVMGDGSHASRLSRAAGFIATAHDMGLLSGLPVKTGMILDALAAWPLIGRKPFAIVCTEVRAEPTEAGGHKLSALRLALVLFDRAGDPLVTSGIQRFLNRYTNAEESFIRKEKTAQGAVYRLVDRRLPMWAAVEWGAFENHYIVGFGLDAWRDVAKPASPGSLADVPWVRQAMEQTNARKASGLLYCDVARLRERLGPGLGEVDRQVLHALQADRHDSVFWAWDSVGRAVWLNRYARVAGRDFTTKLAEPLAPEDEARMVPAEADWYSAFRWDGSATIGRISAAYLVSRSPENRRRVEEYWSSLAKVASLDFQQDLIDQLGDRIVVHNHPPHPLGVGLLSTFEFSVSGSTTRVSDLVERLFKEWSGALRRNFPGQLPDLTRTDDGIWYLNFGLQGPAVAVTDGWIIVGPSPMAVRVNLNRLRRTVGKPEAAR